MKNNSAFGDDAAGAAGDGGDDIHYHSRRHGAFSTGDYIFAQLIPYLGNKRKLLPLIAEAIRMTGVMPAAGGSAPRREGFRSGPSPTPLERGGRRGVPPCAASAKGRTQRCTPPLREGVFADMFAGSGVVSRWAKQSGFTVVANDWEAYSEQINGCYIGLNAPPPGLPALLGALNDPQLAEDGYFTEHYCPADDEHPDPERERCFYTRANGRRLDGIVGQIAAWEREGRIDARTKTYLTGPLLYAASYVSNTSGVFKAYHNGWGGQTGTALYRILSDIHLIPPVLYDNGRANIVTRADAAGLACGWNERVKLPIDIAYLDPPYNQHPYGSNYHLLNTVALNDQPAVARVARGSKSAIRLDWRTERRSPYNHRATALPALMDLVDALPARWVLTSYSTEGNMPVDRLLLAMAQRGETRLVTQRYKRYRVSTQRMSHAPHTVEFVVILDKWAPSSPHLADEHVAALEQARLAMSAGTDGG